MGLLGRSAGRGKRAKLANNSILPEITVTDVDVGARTAKESTASAHDEMNLEGTKAREEEAGPNVTRYSDIFCPVEMEREPANAFPAAGPITDIDLEAQQQHPPRMSDLAATADGIGSVSQRAPLDCHGQNKSGQANPLQRRQFPTVEVLVNFATILIASLGTEAVFRLIGPYKRGFFCDDDSIHLPYKSSTVPAFLLFFYCFFASGLAFFAGEYLRLTNRRTSGEQVSGYEHGQSLGTRLLIRWIFFSGYFFIALAATHIFTNIAKYPVGRLRPHFLDLCKPNISGEDVRSYCSAEMHQHIFVETYECTQGNPLQLAEARLSFFSGHSSLSMCTAVFTTIYLHSRISPLFRRQVTLVPLVQICLLSLAMFIGYSRIQDHMHHWSDVLIGMTSGSGVASFVAINIAGLRLGPGSLPPAGFMPVPNDAGSVPPFGTANSNGRNNRPLNASEHMN